MLLYPPPSEGVWRPCWRSNLCTFRPLFTIAIRETWEWLSSVSVDAVEVVDVLLCEGENCGGGVTFGVEVVEQG